MAVMGGRGSRVQVGEGGGLPEGGAYKTRRLGNSENHWHKKERTREGGTIDVLVL